MCPKYIWLSPSVLCPSHKNTVYLDFPSCMSVSYRICTWAVTILLYRALLYTRFFASGFTVLYPKHLRCPHLYALCPVLNLDCTMCTVRTVLYNTWVACTFFTVSCRISGLHSSVGTVSARILELSPSLCMFCILHIVHLDHSLFFIL